VASSSFSEPMRMFAELTIIEGVQDQPDDFREQFVAPDGHIHSTLPL
jgi:hypothetical protein